MKLFSFKPNQKEYTPDMMPHTRKEVFFDVLKLQWRSLLSLGALVLAASIPLVACYVIEQLYSSMMLDGVTDLQDTAQYMSVMSQINVFSNIMSFVKIPFFALLGFVLSGVARIIRQHGYEECVNFSHDFSEGIKQNAKQTVALWTLYSFVGAISYFAYGLNGLTDGVMTVVSMLPMVLFVVIFTPICAVMMALIPIYANNFSRNFKWALYVFAKKPFKIMLLCLCVSLVFALCLIPNFYAGLFGNVIGFLLTPIAMLGFYLAMFNILDELINKDNYPEIVGKGTF